MAGREDTATGEVCTARKIPVWWRRAAVACVEDPAALLAALAAGAERRGAARWGSIAGGAPAGEGWTEPAVAPRAGQGLLAGA